MKDFFRRHKEILWAIYIPIYFICFFALEKKTDANFHTIHCSLDDSIPFIDYFIIPYYLWFLFMAVAVLGIYFMDRFEFNKLALLLVLGMTTFIIVSYVYPNQLTLRPASFPDHGLVTKIVRFLYTTDTSTNVLPSIHVFNTLAVTISILKSGAVKKAPVISIIGLILAVLIILSTVFLKQHSIIDVIAAFIMAAVYYIPAYVIMPKIVMKRTANV